MTTRYLLFAATAALVPAAEWAAAGLTTTSAVRARDRVDSATSISALDAGAINPRTVSASVHFDI